MPLERAQRAIIKVMLGKPRRYSTTLLYNECSVLTVRQLFILKTILRKHRDIDLTVIPKRRAKRLCCSVPHNTASAGFQYYVICNHLYNTANRVNNIVSLAEYQCKQKIMSWLKGLTFSETKEILTTRF
jgi:hypothetical protein